MVCAECGEKAIKILLARKDVGCYEGLAVCKDHEDCFVVKEGHDV